MENAIEEPKVTLYSRNTIYVFAALMNNFFGGMLLASNYKRLGLKKLQWKVLMFSAVYSISAFILSGYITELLKVSLSSSIVIGLNVSGAILLQKLFFDKHMPQEYSKNKIWKPLICSIVISALFIGWVLITPHLMQTVKLSEVDATFNEFLKETDEMRFIALQVELENEEQPNVEFRFAKNSGTAGIEYPLITDLNVRHQKYFKDFFEQKNFKVVKENKFEFDYLWVEGEKAAHMLDDYLKLAYGVEDKDNIFYIHLQYVPDA